MKMAKTPFTRRRQVLKKERNSYVQGLRSHDTSMKKCETVTLTLRVWNRNANRKSLKQFHYGFTRDFGCDKPGRRKHRRTGGGGPACKGTFG